MAGSINLKIPLNNKYDSFFDGNKDTLSYINENIMSLLLTKKYERPMSSVGLSETTINNVLFEPISENVLQGKLSSEIRKLIDKYIVDNKGNQLINVLGVKLYTKEKNPELVTTYDTILVKIIYRLNNIVEGDGVAIEEQNQAIQIEINNT